MLQRNTSGYTLTVPELGREFGPGDEVEADAPICGFTPVKDESKPDATSEAERPAGAPVQQSGKPKNRNARSGGDRDGEQQ